MYQPAHKQFIEARSEKLHELIRAHPLGTLLTNHHDQVEANHVPFLLDVASGKLNAHVPRANPVWQGLTGQSALVIFHGPDAYVSPAWYPSKQVHGKVAPTWNYAVVHVRGSVRVIEDRAWLRGHLDDMTDTHERALAHPWKVSDAPAEYVDKLLSAIVGIEIAIVGIEGKFKLGQHRSPEDRQGVLQALDNRAPALAAFTREHLI